MRSKLIGAIAAVVVLSGAGVAFAVDTFYNDTPRGHQVAATPQISIENVDVKRNEQAWVEVSFINLHFMPEARTPNANVTMEKSPQTVGEDGILIGHIHVYFRNVNAVVPAGDPVAPRAETFCILPTQIGGDATSGLAVGACGAPLVKGEYEVFADVQTNAHAPVYKLHPQDIPAVDKITIKVR